MSILKIIRYPNPILKKKCKAVAKVDAKIKKLIEDMFETMKASNGIGLAAPQVAQIIRVIVVDVGNDPIALINPKIVKKSKETQIIEEGCLCLPGIVGPVERSAKIKVAGLDRKGNKVEYDATGLLATVFQHEIDHLDGKVFIDRIKDASLIKYVPPESEPKEEKF